MVQIAGLMLGGLPVRWHFCILDVSLVLRSVLHFFTMRHRTYESKLSIVHRRQTVETFLDSSSRDSTRVAHPPTGRATQGPRFRLNSDVIQTINSHAMPSCRVSSYCEFHPLTWVLQAYSGIKNTASTLLGMVASGPNLCRSPSCNVDVDDLESSGCDPTCERSESVRCAVISLDHLHRKNRHARTPYSVSSSRSPTSISLRLRFRET